MMKYRARPMISRTHVPTSDKGVVLGVCLSEGIGTAKSSVSVARLVAGRGFEGDGHAGTQRQVSILQGEHVQAFNAGTDLPAGPGDFAENILTRGIDLGVLKPGDRLRIGEAVLEVTQVGKEVLPHHYSFHGQRLLPTLGIFCRVVEGGRIVPGMKIRIESGNPI